MHGLTNRRPEGHWERRLANALRDRGELALYPQLPNPDSPRLREWCELIAAELAILREAGTGEVVVVGHSLGAVVWLHMCAGHLIEPVDRVLLVAPAAPETLGEVPEFVLDPIDVAARVHEFSRSVTIVGSDADPWLPRGVQATYGDALGVDCMVIDGAAHLALGDGWGPWQGVIDWVIDPSADLTRR